MENLITKSNQAQRTIQIAILGAQGPNDPKDNNAEEREIRIFQEILACHVSYKDEYGNKGRFIGLKHVDPTKGMRFEPIERR